MDPAPLSLLSILLSARLLVIFNAFFIVLLLLSLFTLVVLFVLGCLSHVLKTIDSNELKAIEKDEGVVFERLQSLFNKNDSMSSLFLLTKLFLIILFSVSAYMLFAHLSINYIFSVCLVLISLMLSIYLLPKALAKDADKWVTIGLGFCNPLLNLFTPLANYFAPAEAALPQDDVSLEELQTALPESEDTKPSVANLALYKQVLRFDKLLIKNVMRPKNEIVGIKAIYNFKEVLTKMQSSSFSRLPVYDGNWGNILGIIHCKDLLPYTHLDTLDWNKFIRPITFVTPDDHAQDVLRIFQKSKNHMAIVRNAASRIEGILTLEDITEEIIGEIEDE